MVDLALKVDLKGFIEYVEYLRSIPIEIEAGLPNAAMAAGQDVVDFARAQFRQPKSGLPRISMDGSGRMMIGSAPGEAPAIDTAKLDNSFTSIIRGFLVETQPNTDYAGDLENGTAKMAARPYMGPANTWAGERYYENVIAIIAGALR
jgi:hypothetical protein